MMRNLIQRFSTGKLLSAPVLLLAVSLFATVAIFFRAGNDSPEQGALEPDPFDHLALGVSDTESPIGEEIEQALKAPWTGDLDGMLERRQIRVLVVHNKLFYFLDGPRQRGLTYETFAAFERFINAQSDTGKRKVHVVFVPVTRSELLPALAAGRGDIAAANLTITPERLELVDFSAPYLEGVDEILVTHDSVEPIANIESLSGRELYIRPSSSYYQSVVDLNQRLESDGKAPVRTTPVDESLEDGDLLEMVNAGLLDMIVVDSHKARMWQQVFASIVLHDEIAFRRDARIAWAIRKDSPKLADALNRFVEQHKKGTEFGNVVYDRYLTHNEWIKNPLAEEERRRLESMVALFREYGNRYDFDWLMLAALAYQESGLDQTKRGPTGAIGVMQLLESTARDPLVGIEGIDDLENNIHAGTKYLDVLRSTYLNDPEIDPLNRTLFTFASYNAGPNRIRAIRDEAGENGFDPDLWFNHVEVLVARYIGSGPVKYVGNIYKYYLAYQLVAENLARRHRAGMELRKQ